METTKKTREEVQTIAKTILQQLGGNRFTTMTGAKNLTAQEEGGLSFRLPGSMTKSWINYVRISLTPMDVYTMEFSSIRAGGSSCTLVSRHEDVYSDMLQKIFTEATGLETSL